jgi:hypothetical protein
MLGSIIVPSRHSLKLVMTIISGLLDIAAPQVSR